MRHIARRGSSAVVGGPVYRGSQIPELYGYYFFSGFPNNPGPIFAVHVDELIERSSLTNLLTLNSGRIAPFVEVRIRHDDQKKNFRQFLRDVNSAPGITRTDARWGVGIDGEIYLLNKNDGVVRRISGIFGVPGVPALGTSGLVILSGLLAAGGAIAIAARRRFGESTGRSEDA